MKIAVKELEAERKQIYNRHRRGFTPAKLQEFNAFSERTGYDWRCIRSADCKDWIGPEGHERCANCLGIV